MFQSRTGFTGHSDIKEVAQALDYYMFQSRTGFTGHSDLFDKFDTALLDAVSIPNGLHRPFRRLTIARWQKGSVTVSIPNGLHRPFRRGHCDKPIGHINTFQSRTGFTGHSDRKSRVQSPPAASFQSRTGFTGHSDSPRVYVPIAGSQFQSRTGFTGHSDISAAEGRRFNRHCFNPERASQAIPTVITTMLDHASTYHVSIPNGLHRPFRHNVSLQDCIR